MRLGIVVQTIALTSVVLIAFGLGLIWHLEGTKALPPGQNPIQFLLSNNWAGVDVITAETMAFVTLSLGTLFRAQTVRSEKESLARLGIFSNRAMLAAIGLSTLLLLLVINVPFLQPVFNTHPLSSTEWGTVIGLSLIPAVAEEMTKFVLRARDRKREARG
jgi:Ca2+-transporting ATPase